MEAWGYIGAAYGLATFALVAYYARVRRRLKATRRALAVFEQGERP